MPPKPRSGAIPLEHAVPPKVGAAAYALELVVPPMGDAEETFGE